MATYSSVQLSNLRDAFTNIISFQVVDGVSQISFQSKTENYMPYKFATRNSDGMPMYLYKYDVDSYRFVTFANAAGVCWYDITPEFDKWLSTYGSIVAPVSITLPNGSFGYVYVTKKRGYMYTPGAYAILWAENPTFWSPPDVSNINNYMTSLYGYDIRVLTSDDFYTQQVKNDILQFVTTGTLVHPAPVINTVYSDTDFTEKRPSDKTFIYLKQDQLEIQLENTSGPVYYVKFADGTEGYVVDQGDGQYRYLLEKSSHFAYVVIDETFGQYLSSAYFKIFTINVSFPNGQYNQLFVTKKPIFTPQTVIYGLDTTNGNYWSTPDTSAVYSWMNNISAYDIRFISDIATSWVDPLVQQAVTDASKTIIALNPSILDPQVVKDNSVSLIYTKSLYDSSSTYFDTVINTIEKEYTDEQKLAESLQNSDSLITELQTFIDTKSSEVHDKLVKLQTLSSNLRSVFSSNQSAMQSNERLHDLLVSQPAVSVSNEITQLRDTIYSSLEFLVNNNRISKNDNIVYVVNKTQL